MIAQHRTLFDALIGQEVQFIVIGAVAMVLHGSARVTRDLDICYQRTPDNLERLALALRPFRPTLRGAPATLPFTLDARTLASGLNFTLSSTAGDIDLLGDVTGLGGFATAARMSEVMRVYDHDVRVLSLDGLERAKRAAGRLKDLADLAEIIEIRRLRGSHERGGPDKVRPTNKRRT